MRSGEKDCFYKLNNKLAIKIQLKSSCPITDQKTTHTFQTLKMAIKKITGLKIFSVSLTLPVTF